MVDARIPEEAVTPPAAELAARLSLADRRLISRSVVAPLPDSNPFLDKEGLLFLQPKQLSGLMDQTIDAQPFLGQLVADPSARGLFSALSLLGMGVTQGDADLSPYLAPIKGFHQAMADALDGHPKPLSWETLLGGGLSELAGPYHFVLAQPHQDFGALEPGGASTQAMRAIIASLPYVQSGDARVRITGQIALADEEFATVAQGAVEGLLGSLVLITLWLFLAVHSWRLIIPILMTLILGLMLTVLFAAVAVGTLNLVSVGFGVLFVGIAVDFAIQFSVRYREFRFETGDPVAAIERRQRRSPRRGADLDRRAGHRRRIPGVRADRLFRRGGAWPDRRRRHDHGLHLHAALPACRHHSVQPPRRSSRGRIRLRGPDRSHHRPAAWRAQS